MSNITVKAIRIDNGIITSDFFGKAKSQKAFFAERGEQPKSTHRVVGWAFKSVHLTHGTMENGSGWAFVR